MTIMHLVVIHFHFSNAIFSHFPIILLIPFICKSRIDICSNMFVLLVYLCIELVLTCILYLLLGLISDLQLGCKSLSPSTLSGTDKTFYGINCVLVHDPSSLRVELRTFKLKEPTSSIPFASFNKSLVGVSLNTSLFGAISLYFPGVKLYC